MDIISSIKNKLISQRGATAIMSAIILPLILAFGGMAVDIGNLYSHHSRLQNAADSAAIAGGHAFRSNKETADDHPYADEAADKYAEKNLPSDINYWVEKEGKNINLPDGRTGSALKVTVYEDVPYHFLRPLFSLLNAPESITISATGYCTLIDIPGGEDPFNSLFIFNKKLGSINNVQNPDNPTIKQYYNNCGTYDGDIMAISPGYDKSYRFETLLTEAAFGLDEYNRTPTITPTVNQAVANGQTANLVENFDYVIDKFYKETVVKTLIPDAKENKNHCLFNPGDYNKINSTDVNQWLSSGVKAVYYNTGNLNITLEGTLAGSPSDEPLYIIFEHINNLNFKADMSNSRRIVFVQAKEEISPYWEPEYRQITMNSNAGEFHGILYAPYGNVFINDNNHEFYGTIAAQNIQLQGPGYYHNEKNIIKAGNTPNDVKVVFGGADFW